MLAHLVNNYLDDILIFAKDLDLHDQYVCSILERPYQNHLYAKLEKLQV